MNVVANVGHSQLEEAIRVFEDRERRFRGLGYPADQAAALALSDRTVHQVKTEIAGLIAKGCPPKLARKIAR